MPRLNVVDPAEAKGRAKELFDGPLEGKHVNILKGMANSGAALDAYVSLSGALADGQLSGKEREVIALAVGRANDCDYCQAAHTALGKGEGLTEAETIEARKGEMGDSKLDALAKFALALHEKRGFVSDGDLEAFKKAGYDDGAVAETIANYALNTFTNYFNHTNQTDVDFPSPPSL